MIDTDKIRRLYIHEGLFRIILRQRWIRWSLRNWKPGCYGPGGRHVIRSQRLHRWKPLAEKGVRLPITEEEYPC